MSIDNPIEPKSLIAAVVDAAEQLREPLEGLVEKTTTDPGAPFAPDVLRRLAALKTEDRAAFEALRAHLKKAGAACRRSTRLLGRRMARRVGAARPRPTF
jgi:hypothetical protein